MLKPLPGLLSFILFTGYLQAQEIKILNTGDSVSIRGLSVVNDQTIWVSGSAGSVGLSTDGGNSWKWVHVPGYEKSDFRDIEAFDKLDAVVMGITQPAVILRTTDGGKSWTSVFRISEGSAFLDAMEFSGNHGVVIGDPENGKIFYAETSDSGNNWNKKNQSGFDLASHFQPTGTGEAFFAASGSNLSLTPFAGLKSGYRCAMVSGGKKSSLYISPGPDSPSRCYPLFMNQGKETTGANSIAVDPSDANQAFIVGGDFSHDTLRYGNSLRIRFNPFSQESPLEPPHGYRSCVKYLNGKQMICCGTSGVDISNDGGSTWKLISNKSFHVCAKAKTGNAVFLAGPHGTIAMLKF